MRELPECVTWCLPPCMGNSLNTAVNRGRHVGEMRALRGRLSGPGVPEKWHLPRVRRSKSTEPFLFFPWFLPDLPSSFIFWMHHVLKQALTCCKYNYICLLWELLSKLFTLWLAQSSAKSHGRFGFNYFWVRPEVASLEPKQSSSPESPSLSLHLGLGTFHSKTKERRLCLYS
jgi:hypothetical protein